MVTAVEAEKGIYKGRCKMKWEKAMKWYSTWGYIWTLPVVLIIVLALALMDGLHGRAIVCVVIAIGMAIKGLSNLRKSRRDPTIN